MNAVATMEITKENQPFDNRLAGDTDATALDGALAKDAAAATTDDGAAAAEPGPVGCYLVYENSSGGRLVLQYSRGEVPDNAVAFFGGGTKPLPRWKFEQNHGRTELIRGIAGGDANRRKYFVGWCQFLKLARQNGAKVIAFQVRGQGVPVDVYGYTVKQNAPEFAALEEGMVDVTKYDAVAVMPKHHEFLRGVRSIHVSNFLELGSLAGASTLMNA